MKAVLGSLEIGYELDDDKSITYVVEHGPTGCKASADNVADALRLIASQIEKADRFSKPCHVVPTMTSDAVDTLLASTYEDLASARATFSPQAELLGDVSQMLTNRMTTKAGDALLALVMVPDEVRSTVLEGTGLTLAKHDLENGKGSALVLERKTSSGIERLRYQVIRVGFTWQSMGGAVVDEPEPEGLLDGIGLFPEADWPKINLPEPRVVQECAIPIRLGEIVSEFEASAERTKHCVHHDHPQAPTFTTLAAFVIASIRFMYRLKIHEAGDGHNPLYVLALNLASRLGFSTSADIDQFAPSMIDKLDVIADAGNLNTSMFTVMKPNPSSNAVN